MSVYPTSPSVSGDSVDFESVSSDTARKSNEKKRTDSSVCSFTLRWSFGINPKAPLVNLCNENRKVIAYGCSHITMLYNFRSKEMFPLQGHQNAIRTLSTTNNGKWLLTADFEQDCVVVVWDTEIRVPICTLFNPHGKEGMTAARISANARYIVTVGNEKYQKVHFWLWTYGKETPDASLELTDLNSERVKEISFNEESPEEFLLTTDFRLIFFKWERDYLQCYQPKMVKKSRRFGIFNCSCFVANTQQVLAATKNGYVLVFNNIGNEDSSKTKVPNSIFPEWRKTKHIQLQKCDITTIQNHNGMIVIGNSRGRISFYDHLLKLLYWCENNHLDSIQTISFAPSPQNESVTTFGSVERAMEESEIYVASNEENCINKEKSYNRVEGESTDVSSDLSINIEYLPRKYSNNIRRGGNNTAKIQRPFVATDATLQHAQFHVAEFIVCTTKGIVALINVPKLKCNFIFQHESRRINCLEAHPESNYIITGDDQGRLSLYNYTQRELVVSRMAPVLPDFRPILEKQVRNNRIIYITCPQIHETLKGVTALKYSPKCDMLACGLENGVLWFLHPITIEPIDQMPYKHSIVSIQDIVYDSSSNYLAYSDNALTVAVLKKNPDTSSEESANVWNFVGKYHSHRLPIRSILFGPSSSSNNIPRFFSLGEDRDLVEYDLEKSGPYPDPGLKILQIDQIEQTAIPFCLAWYPQFGQERFLVICNSEYKFRLVNDLTKMIRGTFLGPRFESPVQKFQILKQKRAKNHAYMVFSTEKEIGLQLLPLDGNPYKIVGMVGHPRKIAGFAVGYDGNILFTSGYNDSCVLMWEIKRRSVDVMARLGGKGLSPYHSLIDGGNAGWLWKEMQDLFYYAQILQQEENTISTREISDRVSTKQIPNLMRAIGFYPSNEELETIMSEVSYKNYAETGKLLEEITFEDFVRLYVNHRPAFGISAEKIREAFRICAEDHSTENNDDNPAMTREQFLNVLLGVAGNGSFIENGESLPPCEASTYLKVLTSVQDTVNEIQEKPGHEENDDIDFDFLPERLSYKDFAANIMGIEFPE